MLGDDWIKLECDELCEEFDRWLRDATDMVFWSENNQEGQLISWKSFWVASKHESKKSDFSGPGCYLLGVGSDYDSIRIRYVGQTKNTLKGRLGNRYIPSKKPDNFDAVRIEQLHLADWLAAHGNDWRKLPDHIIATDFFNAPKGSNTSVESKRQNTDTRIKPRIKHAIDFAERIAESGRNGSDHMWFALIPMTSSERTKSLECYLLATLIRWNDKHDHPRLLNDVY